MSNHDDNIENIDAEENNRPSEETPSSEKSESSDVNASSPTPPNVPSSGEESAPVKIETAQIKKDSPPDAAPHRVPPQNSNLTMTEKFKKSMGSRRGYEKYDIKGELARGGMGIIYRIFDKELRRALVMKVLQLQESLSEEERQKESAKFIEEARITAQLEHPNVVPVHEMGLLADDNVYFTMKIVEGEELSLIVKKLSQKDPATVKKYNNHNLLTIFRKVCDAIAFGHSRDILHRDIKPHNIMIGQYGEALVMDWGLGKYIGGDNPPEEELKDNRDDLVLEHLDKTVEGTVLGTPLYMSPEQARGLTKQIDKLTDIYLLGATLYHMMTFTPPHIGKNINEVLMSAGFGRFHPPEVRNPGQQIPQELCRIIMKAMALRKEERYQTVQEMSSDIDALMSGNVYSEPIIVKKGEFLIREGEEGKEAYSIVNGRVDIFKEIGGKSVLLATIGPGSVVGEMGLITTAKRSADVVAAEDTEVIEIDNKRLKEVFDRMPPWTEKIVSTLADRLTTANNNAHPLLIGDPCYHVLNQLGMTATLLTVKERAGKVENIEIDFTKVVEEIAANLSLPTQKVYEPVLNLVDTEICEWVGSEKFRFKNFLVFCHVLDFVRGIFEVQKSLKWVGPLPALEGENKILRIKVAAKLSKEVRNFLADIPMYAKLIEED